MEPEKREAGEETQAFLGDSSEGGLQEPTTRYGSKRRVVGCVRLAIEIAMAAVILYLLAAKPYCGRDTIRRTPVPKLPRKIYTFKDDPKYVNGDMWFDESTTLKTLHNWIPLSSKARGYIVVKDSENYDLPKPYKVNVPVPGNDRSGEGPGYMMTVFHQLHCLSYVAKYYQQGYGGVNLTEEVAHHTAHCFNYLRQGIMCSADVTLEGETEEGPGEGSEHECVDYDALLEWANEHSAMPWRGNLPEEAIL